MVRETKVVPDHPYKGGILKRLTSGGKELKKQLKNS